MIERDVQHVALQYLEAIDSPVSLAVAILIKAGEWEQIAVKRTDPRLYEAHSVDKFRRDYLATELLRKFPDLPLKADPKDVARGKFWESERECAKANIRLRPYIHDPLSEDCDPAVSAMISRIRKNIYDVIGGYPPEIDLRYGPGSTYESKELSVSTAEKRNLTLGDKFEQQLHLTPSAECFQPLFDRNAVGRARARVSRFNLSPCLVRGNRFFTVPKDATTERGACAEPGGNVNVQMGLGRAIRAYLRLTGIDLSLGQQTHGERALKASRDASDATIDLRSASDTISRKLVELVLPPGWFTALDCARSRLTEIAIDDNCGVKVPEKLKKGKVKRWVYLEKFSSMGNGFTFELETLIFLAICRSVVPKGLWNRVTVYGDDIIVPTEYASDVLSVLKFFGFTPNDRKTFTTSEFRESCGTDAFAGVQVKAYRWDSTPTSPLDWISVHNGMHRALNGWRHEAVIQPVRAAIRSKVPTHLWLFGPEMYGDAVVHHPEWRRLARLHVRKVNGSVDPNQLVGFGLAEVSPKLDIQHFHPEMQLALALYGAESDGLGWRKSNDEPKSYKKVLLSFS